MSHLRKITTVVTDILGTILNKHNTSLRKPFINAFEKYGIPISSLEMNKPTGISKNEHIAEILRMPSVASRFEKEKKRQVNLDRDVKAIFKLYEPLQIAELSNPNFIRPLPGIINTLIKLKEMGIKIVATTGFKSTMVRAILANSEEKIGQYLDDVIACDDSRIKRGRPYPDEIWAAMISAGCEHPSSCVKADDTNPGILAGNSAGVKTLALTRYNNFTGLYTDDIDLLEKTNSKAYLKLMRESWEHMEISKPTYICQTLEGIIPLINLYNSNLGNPISYPHRIDRSPGAGLIIEKL